MIIRNYKRVDYGQVKSLYMDENTFGGQFDEARDTEERLELLVSQKPNCIQVAQANGDIVGAVTIFEDGRSCWLYRFAVKDNDIDVSNALANKAKEICRELGHEQVLVYAPAGDKAFEGRYTEVGFNKGGNYTSYWLDLK